MESVAGEVTTLLAAAGNGDSQAVSRLWEAVYAELRQVAHGQMAREGHGDHLQTTVLVHEAYLRLIGPGNNGVSWDNRRHFFGAAAKAMRRIRVDEARKRHAAKRSAPPARPAPDVTIAADTADAAELIAIDEALHKLEGQDPRRAEIVSLLYFGGLTIDETAAALDLSPRTIDSEWRFAKAWLHRELSGQPLGQS